MVARKCGYIISDLQIELGEQVPVPQEARQSISVKNFIPVRIPNTSLLVYFINNPTYGGERMYEYNTCWTDTIDKASFSRGCS